MIIIVQCNHYCIIITILYTNYDLLHNRYSYINIAYDFNTLPTDLLNYLLMAIAR